MRRACASVSGPELREADAAAVRPVREARTAAVQPVREAGAAAVRPDVPATEGLDVPGLDARRRERLEVMPTR